MMIHNANVTQADDDDTQADADDTQADADDTQADDDDTQADDDDTQADADDVPQAGAVPTLVYLWKNTESLVRLFFLYFQF